MNKAGLIEKIKESRATFRKKRNDEERSEQYAYKDGVVEGLSIALTHAHQLNESKPVELPKILINTIEEWKERRQSLHTVLVEEYFNDSSEEIYSDEVYYAIHENFDDFCFAYVTGKYVEKKKQKYYVLNKKGHLMLKRYQEGISEMKISSTLPVADYELNKEDIQLTEEEIKNYDGRFWAFAIPVDSTESE